MKSEPRSTTKYKPHLSRTASWTVIGGVTFILIFSLSETAHAGLLSFVSNLFSTDQAVAKIDRTVSVFNSQTLNILQAHTNIDPTSDVATDVVPVDDGQTLVPDISAANSTSTDTGNMQISTYTVRDGDTISGVAKMFKVSVNTVLWANNLTGKSVLKTGQTLVILPISGISYTVKKGDTVRSIAAKYKADENDITSYNDLTVSSLQIGQIIVIPDAELSADNVTPVSNVNTVAACGVRDARIERLLDGGSSLPAYLGYYLRPIVGGYRSQCLHGHNAIDLAAPIGTPIRAAAAGTVIIAKINGAWNGGYGNYVVISHNNGTQTLYAHMSRQSVEVGSQVSQGQNIGAIGMTGWTYGPHVHFEIRGAQNPF